MKTTTDDEIEIVRQRLVIFEGNLDENLEARLLAKTPRQKQHKLFWLLLDDNTFSPIKESLEIMKAYAAGKYYKKAVRKLTEYGDPQQYQSNVAEMVAAAFYMKKFKDDDAAVTWERKIQPGNKSVDVTLNNHTELINIEFTGLVTHKALSDYYAERYKFKDTLEPLILDTKDPKYSYVLTFEDFKLDGDAPDLDVKQFADFIVKSRRQGPGTYKYEVEGQPTAEIMITLLNKLDREYIADMTIWSGQIRDSLRMKSKVVDKAKGQLPKGEINFVVVSNQAMLDKEDYVEAMYGLSVVRYNPANPDEHEYGRADDGISKETDNDDYADVHGIIMAGFNFFDDSKKFIVANIRKKLPDEVYDLVAKD